jgi:hypothetical protein
MLKSCFDCDSETIITDVIHRPTHITQKIYRNWSRHSFIIENFILYDKIVEYTCRQCGTKYYVTVGSTFKIEEVGIF